MGQILTRAAHKRERTEDHSICHRNVQRAAKRSKREDLDGLQDRFSTDIEDGNNKPEFSTHSTAFSRASSQK